MVLEFPVAGACKLQLEGMANETAPPNEMLGTSCCGAARPSCSINGPPFELCWFPAAFTWVRARPWHQTNDTHPVRR